MSTYTMIGHNCAKAINEGRLDAAQAICDEMKSTQAIHWQLTINQRRKEMEERK